MDLRSELLEIDAFAHAHALDIVDVDGDGFGFDVLFEREFLAAKAFERGLGLKAPLGQAGDVVSQLAHLRHQARLGGGEGG